MQDWFEHTIIYPLIVGIRYYPYYILAAVSLLSFFVVNRVFKSRLNLQIKALLALWPFLAAAIFSIFDFVDYGKMREGSHIIIFATFTFILVEILARIKSKVLVLLVLILVAIIFFPRVGGGWGMTTRPYKCQCLGVEVITEGADTIMPMCYGIPYRCGALQQSWPNF